MSQKWYDRRKTGQSRMEHAVYEAELDGRAIALVVSRLGRAVGLEAGQGKLLRRGTWGWERPGTEGTLVGLGEIGEVIWPRCSTSEGRGEDQHRATPERRGGSTVTKHGGYVHAGTQGQPDGIQGGVENGLERRTVLTSSGLGLWGQQSEPGTVGAPQWPLRWECFPWKAKHLRRVGEGFSRARGSWRGLQLSVTWGPGLPGQSEIPSTWLKVLYLSEWKTQD